MQQKGITLISLVITIIILLILAGISINFAIGDNGIFKFAGNAVEKYDNAAKKEEYELAKANSELSDYIKGSRNDITPSVILDETAVENKKTYTISDISKYNFIEVQQYIFSTNNETKHRVVETNLFICVSDIEIGNNGQYFLSNYATPNYRCYLGFGFTSTTNLYISDIDNVGWTTMYIKILGY